MTREPREPSERFVRVAAAIRDEITRLDRLVSEATSARQSFAASDPSALELRGLGDLVHDFYTGAERVFQRIAPELNGGVPQGTAWHRDLLSTMALELPNIRPPVLAKATVVALDEYLRFRHVFRNVYGYELEWSRIATLLDRMPDVWRALRGDLEGFCAFLDRLAAERA